MKRHLTVAGGVLVSVLLLLYAMRDVSAAELLAHLGDANFWWLGAAVVAATGTFWIRAIRWRILLLPGSGEIPFGSRLAAVCIGFMANNLLPARLGEFARAYSLSRIAPVGVSATFATLVVERLLDAVVMMAFLIPAYLLGASSVSASGLLPRLLAFLVVFVSAGLVAVFALVRFPGWVLRFSDRWSHRILPRKAGDRVTAILASFIAGLGAVRHAGVFAHALLWSVAVWGWNAVSFYLGFLAFDIHGPGIPGAMLLQTVIGFAVAIPSTPGFFGPFEAAARAALELYGIAPARIISFAAGYHILTFIPVTLLGIFYMRRLGITRRELGHSDELLAGRGDAAGQGEEDRAGAASG